VPRRAAAVDIAVIGGSGFYSLLEAADGLDVETPYGLPAAPITVGRLGGRSVAFLPRHGVDHQYAPHAVPARANLWALRSLGARQIVSLSAVGSLRATMGAGTLVLPDQIVDRTCGRAGTFVEEGRGVVHVSFADPYCPHGRAAARDGARHAGLPLIEEGTLVVINGPRFSTRAESAEYQRLGGAIIGMTAMPEAVLARELALCYTTLALVTDLDAGVQAGEGVTHADVLEQFALNLPRLREWLVATVARLPAQQRSCDAADVYDEMPAAFELP
jgi:5'-methylthioadenosine phosphorylase